jgi:hypothetical protein
MRVDSLELHVLLEDIGRGPEVTLRIQGLDVKALAAGGGEFAMHLRREHAVGLAANILKLIEGAP